MINELVIKKYILTMFSVSGKLKRMKKCSNRQNEAWKTHFKSRQRAPSAAGLLAAAPRWTKLCGTLLNDSQCLIDVVKVSLLIRNKNITCKYIFFSSRPFIFAFSFSSLLFFFFLNWHPEMYVFVYGKNNYFVFWHKIMPLLVFFTSSVYFCIFMN